MMITHVVGARPNFMKVAPVMEALREHAGISQVLVHTGQHYDSTMSDVFFHQLGMPQPDVNLEVGSASHAVQTGQIMISLEQVLLDQRPDLVLVYGDVNSTVATALVCAKLLIPVGHVEAGLRSFDRTMPEEINRLVTDQIADFLFTPSADGDENLRAEGVAADKIYRVGNVMIDSLVRLLPETQARWDALSARFDLDDYGLVTLHRPSNVDEPSTLARILRALVDIACDLPLIFPIHPRTRQRLADYHLEVANSKLRLTEPLGYLDFLALQQNAGFVITDSGGIQEETTFLGVPCLTVRENTERPITVTLGTNMLVGQDMTRLKDEVLRIVSGECKRGKIPPLWDGRAGKRIADIVAGRSGASEA
jgi:UDP-N-acetylglucosamine 2-epimerase (non-hydrolysing)